MTELSSVFSAPGGTKISVAGLRGAAASYLAQLLIDRGNRPLVAVCPTEEQALSLQQDFSLFSKAANFLFPAYDIPPYTPLSPDPQTVADRIATLYKILTSDSPFLLTVSAEALVRRLPPKEQLTGLAELILRGEDTDQKQLVNRLVKGGFEAAALVQNVGEFSVRGGIIDIFSPGYEWPVRLDFFGDTIESLRYFDPISQRSIGETEEIIILPACDLFLSADEDRDSLLQSRFQKAAADHAWPTTDSKALLERLLLKEKFPGIEFYLPLFYRHTASLFDFLPADSLLLYLDVHSSRQAIELTEERIAANFREAKNGDLMVLPPESLFLTPKDIERMQNPFVVLEHGLHQIEKERESAVCPADGIVIRSGNHKLLQQQIDITRKEQGILGHISRTITNWLDNDENVFLSCRSAKRARHLAELFEHHGLLPNLVQAPLTLQPSGHGFYLVDSPLSEGFDLLEENIHFLSETELFGEKRIGKKAAARSRTGEAVNFDELHSGDLIVHKEHGLGIYRGIISFTHGELTRDYLQIEYQEEDKLYVPADRLQILSKYKGIADHDPKIDKLGGKSWVVAKKKVKEAVWKVAQELLDLYARRKITEGHSFSMPQEYYHELEESFPFEETSGQLAAINDVINDLTDSKPMDRLVCGDVGYGKTEVAIRAAFKVVEDSHQVALLVPTTVLAEQHLATFRERLQGFPVRVECLNRFRTQAEQRDIVKGISDGTVDIVIGTHRLFSKDVRFKRLGLLIIDEEHRFGVTHKEKLKKYRTKVDVLTLTATPIPRTLQLSLLTIRDLSVISTPPALRRSVKTFVAKQDDLIVKEAITRELLRKGQVFVVHNRVKTIGEMAKKVNSLVPQARVAIAHGQMPGKTLEEIMVRFVRREIDVLLCTTIIESGLDIPNANTIIITRADRLGLAEIYQLRGRVGRGKEQAYAYLLLPSLDNLSRDSQQRLRALMDYNELGGGFKLAMSDLQIRGGGNILGESQSGNIAAVGYDLYLELLQKTVEDLKRKKGGELETSELDIDPEVNLQLSAHIPENYVPDTDQRYFAYRKISNLSAKPQFIDLREELQDRFGPLPSMVENLFFIMELKNLMKKLGIEKLEQGKSTLVFHFSSHTVVAPEAILAFLERQGKNTRFTPDAKLIVPIRDTAADSLFSFAKNILRAFLQDATNL